MSLELQAYHNLHSQWFNGGPIAIDLLNDWRDHRKTEMLHYYLETKIVTDFESFFDARAVACSYGSFPAFDVRLSNSKTVEIKITSKEGNSVIVETEKIVGGDWQPSGLSLSVADYYLFLQPGIINKKDPIAMKVRVIDAEILRSLAKISRIKEFGDTKGFELYFGNLANDGWIGSYPYDAETNSFDITSPTIAHKFIKRIKDDTRTIQRSTEIHSTE